MNNNEPNENDINDEQDGIEFSPDIMTLVDEDGVEHEFEVADTLDIEDVSYVALIPVYDEASEELDDSGELVVLKVIVEDGVDFLEAIEDEAEFDKVSAMFMERLESEYDFEE